MRNPTVAAAARELAHHRGQQFEQHDVLLAAMRRVTTVDAFYVAEFVGDDSIHYHHQYDGDVFDLPGSHSVRPGGMAAWVRHHRRTYQYGTDNGRLLNAGISFGKLDKRSRDALVAPVFDGGRASVIGLVSIQTYRPNCYDTTVVATFESLIEAFAAQLAHEHALTGTNEDQSEESFISHVLAAIGAVHSDATRDLRQVGKGLRDPEAALRKVKRQLERLLSDLWARELGEHRRVAAWLDMLTPRQRELALLMGHHLGRNGQVPSNDVLAAEMNVASSTIKTYINAALRVFDAQDKHGVAAAVWRLLETRDHRES
ncbi:hypothetical protein DMC64_02535 [Amycolatopsis sp. WAC 04197]|uniref:response regulator transcription factor n=1 Tax=Amycolatopsis sp. WAC 04197 TaxID=2203199 RepID=UPI000F7A6E93|nr:response regulator transcription factor [Amycolatopsis sp. WAC 04197]RSN49460.1 hypothetical protein DMC64_02535 [Amycolatopsis sp. WAC 04197]